MPELAEVETVRRVLKSELIGQTITKIDLLYAPIFENSEAVKDLIGQTYVDIKRQGKYLIFCLSRGYLLSHLRMEGKYFYTDLDYPLNKHMHVIIYLDNGKKLIYQDVRKFGRMHYYEDLASLEADLDLGPDANLALPYLDELYAKLAKSRLPLKSLLLDQSFIAGLGNIYVDEVIYAAKLLPNMPANLVTKDELKTILEASKEILDLAIINKGTTIRSYTSSLGVIGNYQNYLKVHTKEKCPLGHEIITYKVGGRTSYVCPVCQTPKKMAIGITGGIASGKSNVLNTLKEWGFAVCDSDTLVKEAYQNEQILTQIKASFGTSKRLELAKIVFNDATKRKELEVIIHPYVIGKLEEAKANNQLVFLDIPLLYECQLEYLVDKVICLKLPLELEIERLCTRDNITKDYALKKINSQLPLADKVALADYVIDSSGSFAETNKKIKEVVKEIFYGLYM